MKKKINEKIIKSKGKLAIFLLISLLESQDIFSCFLAHIFLLEVSLDLPEPDSSLPQFAAQSIIRHDSYSARFYKVECFCMAFPFWF